MSDTKVGILIEESAQRDAIHIAVAPVVSSGRFNPGEHVGFMPDGRVGIRAKEKIGIIDPFLKDGVTEGERCWLFLYPQTVTGMRHHWSHPAFSQQIEVADPKGESEKWLRAYASKFNAYSPPEVGYQRLVDGLKTNDLYAHGSDLHGFYELEDADLLKYHAERLLGIQIEWGQFQFRCTC